MLHRALLCLPLLLPPAFAQTTSPAAATAEPSDVPSGLFNGKIVPPRLISQPEPKYPRSIFGHIKPGRVLVGMVVSTAGLPENLHIVRSGGSAFDKSALQCVAQYRFSPAMRDGKPIPLEVNIDINFQIVASTPPPTP